MQQLMDVSMLNDLIDPISGLKIESNFIHTTLGPTVISSLIFNSIDRSVFHIREMHVSSSLAFVLTLQLNVQRGLKQS